MTLEDFPKNIKGKIISFVEMEEKIPIKILEMGIVPEEIFEILYQAPFDGPLYIVLGEEKTKIALGISEAKKILVEKI